MQGGGLWLGIDTGGTFTDAVLLADGRRVVASDKALTTHWDLAIGIGAAIRAVLGALPEGTPRTAIGLVSVSTTLATNAVVENRFSSVCTLVIGFDAPMVARSRTGVTSSMASAPIPQCGWAHTIPIATGPEGSRSTR